MPAKLRGTSECRGAAALAQALRETKLSRGVKNRFGPVWIRLIPFATGQPNGNLRRVLYVGTGAFSRVTGARLLAGPAIGWKPVPRLGCQTAGELGAPSRDE